MRTPSRSLHIRLRDSNEHLALLRGQEVIEHVQLRVVILSLQIINCNIDWFHNKYRKLVAHHGHVVSHVFEGVEGRRPDLVSRAYLLWLNGMMRYNTGYACLWKYLLVVLFRELLSCSYVPNDAYKSQAPHVCVLWWNRHDHIFSFRFLFTKRQMIDDNDNTHKK